MFSKDHQIVYSRLVKRYIFIRFIFETLNTTQLNTKRRKSMYFGLRELIIHAYSMSLLLHWHAHTTWGCVIRNNMKLFFLIPLHCIILTLLSNTAHLLWYFKSCLTLMTSLYDFTRLIITLNWDRITSELDTILYNTFLQF